MNDYVVALCNKNWYLHKCFQLQSRGYKVNNCKQAIFKQIIDYLTSPSAVSVRRRSTSSSIGCCPVQGAHNFTAQLKSWSDSRFNRRLVLFFLYYILGDLLRIFVWRKSCIGKNVTSSRLHQSMKTVLEIRKNEI